MNIFIDTAPGGSVHAASIFAALQSWWDFEENNGTASFLDAHGSNHLSIQTAGSSTASSTAGGASGKVGRSFQPANTADRTAYIPRSNTALDLPNSDWSFGGWFNGYPVAGGWTGFVIGRYVSGGIQATLAADSSASAFYQFLASSNGSSTTALTSTVGATGGTISSSSHLIVCALDRTNNLLRLRIKNATSDYTGSVAFAGALYTGSSSANFCINDSLSGDSTFLSGSREMTNNASFDSCFYASKVLSEDEFLYLYNAGAGVNYAQLAVDAA